VEFQPDDPRDVEWIIVALQTITPEHQDLRQITISVYDNLIPSDADNIGADAEQTVGEANFRQWLNLDRLLVQIWESRSIRPKVIFTEQEGMSVMRDCMGCLLPEITKKGIIDLVDDL
jgi:hypothetical protein